MLAWALWNGYGLDENKEEALEMYRRAKDTDKFAMYELGMIYLFELGQECENEGLKLLLKAAENGNENAKKFMAAYEEAKSLFSEEVRSSNTKTNQSVIAALHKSLQYKIKLSPMEIQQCVLGFITFTNNANTLQSKSVKQLAKYLLLLAHVLYLREEAPDDEQNICMIIELLEAGVTDEIESDADLLYNFTRDKKGDDHTAIQAYDKYHALTGSSDFSYASQVAKDCRGLFPALGSRDEVSFNIASSDDALIIADILAYSFQAIGVDDIEKWEKANEPDLESFRNELKTFYETKGGTNVTYKQLSDCVSESFSKTTLEKCMRSSIMR